MKITVNYSTNTRFIKEKFNKLFPYLKIEFFDKPHAPGEASAGTDMIQHNMEIGAIHGVLKDQSIVIGPQDTVASVELAFQSSFGLFVQVFRKQKNAWIETTRTDQLTLAEQNEKGEKACLPVEQQEPEDRYLSDGQY